MKRFLCVAAVLCYAALPLCAAEPRALFEDRFEGKLGDGWSWLREHKEFWRIKDGALEIHDQPGDAGSVKNALVRKAPDRSQGKVAIDITITSLAKPIKQWEQAGITWYQNGRPVFKLVKELVDGRVVIVPGFKPIATDTVQLRVIVTADSWIGQFRPDAKGNFETTANGKLAPAAEEQVSLQCYHGPTEAEHWFRFDDFRITKLAE